MSAMDEDTSQALLEHTEQMKRLYGERMDINAKLLDAMKELAGTSKGKMDFRGKSYATVALRVEMLRKHLGAEVSIATDIVSISDETVVMRATIGHGEQLLATGYAEEHRSGKGVNSTSALENCETSAVGRALAALGLGGGEYASADELTGAIGQQNAPRITDEQAADIEALIEDVGADRAKFLRYFKVSDPSEIPASRYDAAVKALESKRNKEAAA